MDNGDFVIIINAEKVALTGSKLLQKKAYRHSGYPGGLTATTYAELLEKTPEKAVENAKRDLKNGKVELFKDASHAINGEYASEVNTEIIKFTK